MDTKNNRRVYEYEMLHLPIPKKFHDSIAPLCCKELFMNFAQQGDDVVLTIRPSGG